MDEYWMPVPSIDGMYASSLGRIKLPERVVAMPRGGVCIRRTSPTYGSKTRSTATARHVYMGVYSRVHGNLKVHRVVCEAFHGKMPDERSVVIHIDEDATNNRPENLRWGTQRENLSSPKFIEYCKSRTGDASPVVKHRNKLEVV